MKDKLISELREWRHDYAHKPLLSATELMERFDEILSRHEAEQGEESANDSFERAAKCFEKATGMIMPGKDIGAYSGWTEEQEEERRKLFKVWCAAIEYMRHPTPDKAVEPLAVVADRLGARVRAARNEIGQWFIRIRQKGSYKGYRTIVSGITYAQAEQAARAYLECLADREGA